MRQMMSAVLLATLVHAPAVAQGVDGRTVRTFVVEQHVIDKDDYARATRGNDARLASIGGKLRPHDLNEVRGQGDVFNGWTQGSQIPYRSSGGIVYEFVGSVGEIQPATRPDYRTLLVRDSRLVRFVGYRDEQGRRVRIPIVRKSEVAIEFPMDGRERSQVYAIPRGKRKFEYRLVTVKEDVSRRRTIRLIDQAGRP